VGIVGARIQRERTLELRHRLIGALEQAQRHAVGDVSLGVDRGDAANGPPLARAERDLQRLHHALGDLVLHGEDVAQLAVEALGPEHEALGDVGELGRDAHALARLAHAALRFRRGDGGGDSLGDLEEAREGQALGRQQLGEGARLARETVQARRVGRQALREDLRCDGALELRVEGLPDHPIPPSPTFSIRR